MHILNMLRYIKKSLMFSAVRKPVFENLHYKRNDMNKGKLTRFELGGNVSTDGIELG